MLHCPNKTPSCRAEADAHMYRVAISWTSICILHLSVCIGAVGSRQTTPADAESACQRSSGQSARRPVDGVVAGRCTRVFISSANPPMPLNRPSVPPQPYSGSLVQSTSALEQASTSPCGPFWHLLFAVESPSICTAGFINSESCLFLSCLCLCLCLLARATTGLLRHKITLPASLQPFLNNIPDHLQLQPQHHRFSTSPAPSPP
jgi:hypothetical protein